MLRERTGETQVGRNGLVRHAHQLDGAASRRGGLAHPEADRGGPRLAYVIDLTGAAGRECQPGRRSDVADVPAGEEQVSRSDRDPAAAGAEASQDRLLAREIIVFAEDDGKAEDEGAPGEVLALDRNLLVLGPGEVPAGQLGARIGQGTIAD